MLALAVFIPASGWVADRSARGRRSLSAIVVFTWPRCCAGFRTSWTFTAARLLQGIGGAMMVPVGA